MTMTSRLTECSAIKTETVGVAKPLLNLSQSDGSEEISQGTGEHPGPRREKRERGERTREKEKWGEQHAWRKLRQGVADGWFLLATCPTACKWGKLVLDCKGRVLVSG